MILLSRVIKFPSSQETKNVLHACAYLYYILAGKSSILSLFGFLDEYEALSSRRPSV